VSTRTGPQLLSRARLLLALTVALTLTTATTGTFLIVAALR